MAVVYDLQLPLGSTHKRIKLVLHNFVIMSVINFSKINLTDFKGRNLLMLHNATPRQHSHDSVFGSTIDFFHDPSLKLLSLSTTTHLAFQVYIYLLKYYAKIYKPVLMKVICSFISHPLCSLNVLFWLDHSSVGNRSDYHIVLYISFLSWQSEDSDPLLACMMLV